jgi:predicted ATP-grasp superfamily ATP-dependent carboligase
MSTVIAVVLAGAAATPADIAEAAAACGHDVVFVAAAGALDEQARAVHTSFGPLVEYDSNDRDAAISRLRKYRPAGITTFSEGMVPLTCEVAAGVELPYHDQDTVTLITNKWAQRQRLAEAGVDALWSAIATSRDEAMTAVASRPGPVVVKPARSWSSQDTHLVTGAAGLPASLTPGPDRPFVIEDYLVGTDEGDFGDYISVESLVAGGQTYKLGVTGKFGLLSPFREQGQFLPTHLPAARAEQAVQLATRAAYALGVRQGLVHTEIKLTADGPRIIEVNGRLGGFHAELYQRATGQNLLELEISVACGRTVAPVSATAGSIEFHFWNQPPLDGGTLRRVDGAELVRRESGVIDYRPRIPVGRELAPNVMTFQLDLLRGSAPDHETMIKTVDQCLAHLRFTFEQPDGVTRVWQASRSGLCVLG